MNVKSYVTLSIKSSRGLTCVLELLNLFLAVDFVYKYDYFCQSLTVNGLLSKIPDFARDRRLGSMTKKLCKV